MLNYKNDSLLLGTETANDLIKNKNEYLLFLDQDKKVLNLFSAFVKKSDFVKKDKIVQPLQKTVYVKISQKLTKIIRKRCPRNSEIRKLTEIYIGRRSNCASAIKRWFGNQKFPLILLRILSKNKKELSSWFNEIEYFTDFLGKSKFNSPKTLSSLLIDKLVYFVGCSMGDGYIDKPGKRWVLVDGSSCKERLKLSHEFVSSLGSLLSKYLQNYSIKENPTKYELIINNKPFCRFLNFFFGLPFGPKKVATLQVPLILDKSKEDLKKYFWRGLFDTDGSACSKIIDFCSSDKNLLNQCAAYLKGLGIKPGIGGHVVNVSVLDLMKCSYIGFSHPRKQIEFLSTLRKGAKFKSVKFKNKSLSEVNEKLIKIHDLLRVDYSNYRIRVNSTALRRNGISLGEVKSIVRELFGYEFKVTSKNLHYFKSKKVADYLRSIFIYEPAWQPINDEEEDQLLFNWNNVWRK